MPGASPGVPTAVPFGVGGGCGWSSWVGIGGLCQEQTELIGDPCSVVPQEGFLSCSWWFCFPDDEGVYVETAEG